MRPFACTGHGTLVLFMAYWTAFSAVLGNGETGRNANSGWLGRDVGTEPGGAGDDTGLTVTLSPALPRGSCPAALGRLKVGAVHWVGGAVHQAQCTGTVHSAGGTGHSARVQCTVQGVQGRARWLASSPGLRAGPNASMPQCHFTPPPPGGTGTRNVPIIHP